MQLNLGFSTASEQGIPHIIKYMGSKKPIIDFVINKIVEIHKVEKPVCDLFAGSCSISAALRRKFNFISNDIQAYSEVLAHTYFSDFSNFSFEELLAQIELSASIHSWSLKKKLQPLAIDFGKINDLKSFYEIENKQRSLLYQPFLEENYFLFTKYYSGTYWSFEQCVWIDSLRKTAESYKNSNVYYAIISSLMYAMSYTTQSTGHFAQYRDGRNLEAMRDILIYRQKSILELFKKKFIDLVACLNNSLKNLQTTTLDFKESLKTSPKGTTIYADPPYAPVHYSRFYHALETLVKYDYPEVEFKGRYRKDRHQSPFSQKGNAEEAFSDLFDGVINKKSQLILSYSDTGVLSIDKIYQLAEKKFQRKFYTLEYLTSSHEHSTMGYAKKRNVTEYLVIAKQK
ncbi:MAG TPA: DNA adenine methylase [Chitinophagaceae bacterium]